jgi:hypothetical protein
MGETEHLTKLVCNPDACSKSSRMPRTARNSISSGWHKITTSSVYSDTDVTRSRRANRLRTPNSMALGSNLLSKFIIRMNSDGDKDHPVLGPSYARWGA